jgi:diaminohydroxyphosphoribosylaminopyrimidine deaminase / 5-amino-6-(5-phosphoribosylamino)uracil reductase
VMNVLVEGGGKLLGEFFGAGLVNEIAFFIAPCILGGGPAAVEWPASRKPGKRLLLHKMDVSKVGPDFLCRARVLPGK